MPPATLRILANATVAPIVEERRAADVAADAAEAAEAPDAATEPSGDAGGPLATQGSGA